MNKKKRGSYKNSPNKDSVICEVCGHRNHKNSTQCHKCNTFLEKDPWYRRINIFARIRKAETDIKKLQVALVILKNQIPK